MKSPGNSTGSIGSIKTPTPSVTLETALFLSLNGKLYSVRWLEPGAGVRMAWRLTRGEDVYDVSVGEWGVACTCGDFTWRQEKHGGECKHIRSLKQVGLLRS